ncbi:Bm19 [Dirofilaria immitis]|nr:Bm19 [Dirofilaria immitis]
MFMNSELVNNMFRRTSYIFQKTVQNFSSRKHAYFGGAVFAAAAVALSDDELKKQPLWYQTAVRKLSFAIKYTDRKGYLDDVILLENLREKLSPYADSTNTDILWRYARVLLEIALWTSSADKNRMTTFLEAEKICKKALDNESPENPNANAHKWYGITLVKLMDFRSNKKIDEAREHLEKAVKLDPKDVRSWQYLGYCRLFFENSSELKCLHEMILFGAVQYVQKDYKRALESHQKAESLEPGFSNENILWLGKVELALGRKRMHVKASKSKTITPRYRNEYKAGLQAREFLLKNVKCVWRIFQIRLLHIDFFTPRYPFMVTRLWKYPLMKTCIVGSVGYLTVGIVDSVDSSPVLDDDEKWRKYRSDFYEFYFKFADVIGKRHYIEEQYRQNIPSGSYLRCAIDSLEKAHQIIRFDSDDRLRRKILRKVWSYHVEKIEIWKQGKRLLKAINELEKALIIDSVDPQVWYYLGIAKYELGEYQQAIDCHLRVMKLKQSECPQNQYHLGLAQKQLNTPKSRLDACNSFKEVLKNIVIRLLTLR